MPRTAETETVSKQAIHPGRYVVDELEERGLTCEELANLIGRPTDSVKRVLLGRKPITKPLARDLERALGIPGTVMRNLQAKYDEARQCLAADPAMSADIQLLSQIPWREFVKRGWVSDFGSKEEKVSELRAHFDVDTLFETLETELEAAFRITQGTNVNSWALAGWLQEGKWQALDRLATGERDVIHPFNPKALRESLPQMRELTRAECFWPVLRRLCTEAGVALEFVPHVRKSGANGVTQWLDEHRPLIQLSLFRKRADIFWFTFFHEVGHVLSHETGQRLFINLDEKQLSDKHEQEADEFAANTLIPPLDWERFVDRECFDALSIQEFARCMGIHPGIVVGRLQKETFLLHNMENDFKANYCESMFTD